MSKKRNDETTQPATEDSTKNDKHQGNDAEGELKERKRGKKGGRATWRNRGCLTCGTPGHKWQECGFQYGVCQHCGTTVHPHLPCPKKGPHWYRRISGAPSKWVADKMVQAARQTGVSRPKYMNMEAEDSGAKIDHQVKGMKAKGEETKSKGGGSGEASGQTLAEMKLEVLALRERCDSLYKFLEGSHRT